MKVLKGGIILLNLCALSLELDNSTQVITDKETLEQLSELQMYINSDTTKKPIIGYKPVAVQYYSTPNGFSGIMLCTLISEGTDIVIIGYDGRITLRILCLFNYNEEEIPLTPYVLGSAEIQSSLGIKSDDEALFNSAVSMSDDLTVDGDLQVDGTITKKVGSSYVEIPTKTIYQHLIVLSGTTTKIVLKLICNVETRMTTMSDVIALINELFNDQGHSGSYPMTIDCNGYFVVSNSTKTIVQLIFDGAICTYEILGDDFVSDSIDDELTVFDTIGQIDTVDDTVYRLN